MPSPAASKTSVRAVADLTVPDQRAQPWKKVVAKAVTRDAGKGEEEVVRDPDARRMAFGGDLAG